MLAPHMMAQCAEAGKLSQDDLRELEKTVQKLERQTRAEGTRQPK
jgi:hypothetical protein